MKKYILILMVLLIGMLIYAFQLPDSIDQSKIPPFVKKKLDEEIQNYFAERRRVCELEALTRAEEYVDSIIVNKISLSVLKGIRFPIKPQRPPSPNDIKLDDTTVIKPIIKK